MHSGEIGAAQSGILAVPVHAVYTAQNRVLLAHGPTAIFIGHGYGPQISGRAAGLCAPAIAFVRRVQDCAAIAHSPTIYPIRSFWKAHAVKIRAYPCVLDCCNRIRRQSQQVHLQETSVVADNPAIFRRAPEDGSQRAGCVACDGLPVAGYVTFGTDDQQ